MTISAVDDVAEGTLKIKESDAKIENENEQIKENVSRDNQTCDKLNCDKLNCNCDKNACVEKSNVVVDPTCTEKLNIKVDTSVTNHPIYANKNSPNKIKRLSSYNPTGKTMNISAFRKKKGKYYVCAKLAASNVILFVDSAADLSITDYATSRLGKVEKLATPIKIRSFDNNSVQEITESTTLKLHFGSVIAIMKFYVCKTEFSIIGIDMLRNSKLNLSLNTKTEIFWIDRYPVKTACSPEEAAKELSMRMCENKVRKERKMQERKQNWARSTHKQIAKPYGLTDIEVTTDYAMDPDCKSVFLSLFDGDDEIDEIYVPSLMLHEAREKFYITVENKSTNAIVFTKGTAIGEVKKCTDKPGRHTVMSYDKTEVQSVIKSMRNLTCADISTEQKTFFPAHSGRNEAFKVNKPEDENRNFQNAITPERDKTDQKQAPNRTREQQTNLFQYSKTNFGQKTGTPEICKLGKKRKKRDNSGYGRDRQNRRADSEREKYNGQSDRLKRREK